MHALRSTRGLIGGLMVALAALMTLPTTAHAGPDRSVYQPNTGRYRLFAGNLGAITINRVYYGLTTKGEVGVDSLDSSTIGGGFWPKGTGNQYMFSSGLQVSGIVRGGPWDGDTTAGLFFDASGGRRHGTGFSLLYNATNPSDVANWPQEARVPLGDASQEVFDDLLRGEVSASQGDVWFLSWEGDPGLNNDRPHPLGILAEYRVMGWNYPSGNEDLIYMIITFYNITSTDPADYAQYRPGMREQLLAAAAKFQQLNESTFPGLDLPDDGYTIDPFYAAFAADPDVTNSAGVNFSSVNLPFAMGYAYHADFPRAEGWTFSPNIFGAPFFAGAGFVGVKYLKSATGPGEIQLFSNTENGGTNFPDPNSAVRAFKYMSGTITPADGVACNNGTVAISRICYVRKTSPADVRFFESSTPVALAAGSSASIVVSYIHAAPVQLAGYVGGTRVLPGDPTILSDATLLAAGANRIDSMMGFNGYTDANSDNIVQQNEMKVIPGSLLAKANTAQSIFDAKFLLPFSPSAPEFFLIPGNGQVTVLWKPSAAETGGDNYFQIASQATVVPPGGGAPVPNALYDPNYRNFDVEGYRIYRGRSDTPTGLKLIAQYDYAGTTFNDFTGQVADAERGNKCAPELGITGSCAGVFDTPTPGVAATKSVGYDINGNLVQVRTGDRTELASGDIINLVADTAVTGQASGFPGLNNTGVPFIFVDNETRNGITYFYAVTAFDVNSVQSTGSGNTSLESARITKRISPRSSASNYSNSGDVVLDGVFGRGVKLTDTEVPTIDPATGHFSKKFPPANAMTGSVGGLVASVLTGEGAVTIKMDSVQLGDPNSVVPHLYYLGAGDASGRTTFIIPVNQSFTNGNASGSGEWAAGSANPELAAAYGGGEGYAALLGDFSMSLEGAYYYGVKARGCVNGSAGFGGDNSLCNYNGATWFSGDAPSVPHPWAGNYDNFNTGQAEPAGGFGISNVGALDGVVTVMEPIAYNNMGGASFRPFPGVLSGAMSSADYKVYWGSGGAVDSVIDVTHNVPVPMTGNIGLTWGILNQSNTTGVGSYDQRPGVLTHSDFTCVDGLTNQAGVRAVWPCAGANYTLVSTAVPGPIAFGRNGNSNARTRAPAANAGFGMYIKGHIHLFELAGGQLPAAGTVWTMRDYIGAVVGGNGGSGDHGPYSFTAYQRPFTAAGAELSFKYKVVNENGASTAETLAKVHTVPDPYYVTSSFEATTTSKIVKFVNLPATATIRIYTTSGVLVRILEHASSSFGGEENWDVRNRNNQFVASGVYFYHVTAENGETTVGRMTIINYAQ